MKISGRKTSSAYELYGFIPKVENGKHTAICKSCNRVLQNTAAARLQKHRNSCLSGRTIDPVHFPNIEVKRRQKTPKAEAVQLNENQNANVKMEESNMDFEDANINDNANDNTTNDYTVDVDATNPARSRITSLQDEINNTFTILHKPIEPCNTFEDEIPIQSPLMAHPQPLEPFESYHAETTTTNTSSAHDIDDEDLIDIEKELDVIEHLMPRSKESKQLLDELSKAETEYYRCKTAYFTKLTENCKIKRTLMLLKSRKLQLEIERLTSES